MDWLDFLTREIAPYSVIGICIAAGITCWRAGSFHPINSRLLRFFISRDDVEDPVIRKSLADQAALISFRMTHGVRTRTLSDAKKLAEFANVKNISLDLIGRAGWVFDLKNLEIIPKRLPRKYWFTLPILIFLIFIPAGLLSLGLTTNSSLLATLKKTHTDLWLSDSDATLVRPFFGDRVTITKSDCSKKTELWVTPEGFKLEDRSILCGIWNDSEIRSHITKEVSKQRKVLFVAFGACLWYVLMGISFVREWIAQSELNKALTTD